MADYGTVQAHADAILALLRADASLVVYPPTGGGGTTVPAGTNPPYVVVQVIADRPDGGRLQHLSTRFRARAYCQCVGANDIAARVVSDRVAAALLDVRPTIAGRSVYPIRHDIGRDPLSTDTTGTTTVTITDVYRLESDPG